MKRDSRLLTLVLAIAVTPALAQQAADSGVASGVLPGQTDQPAVSPAVHAGSEVARLREQYAASERAAREIVGRLAGTNPADVEGLRQQLRSQVAQSFRIRRELHQAELAELDAQLQQARETIASRDRLQEEIIERRVADLLNPALRWEQEPAGTAAAGPSPITPPAATADTFATQASGPSPLDRLLEPLWPLLKRRQRLLSLITELELLLVDEQEPIEASNPSPEAAGSLEKALAARSQRVVDLQRRIESLRDERSRLDQQIDLIKRNASIHGLIVTVGKDGTVGISLGHDDGIRRGMQLRVFEGNTTIGEIEVVRTHPDASVARVLTNHAEQPIRRGQSVTMLHDDRLLAELIGQDAGQPIYNDRLQRFKFRLEQVDVTDEIEAAEWFLAQYRNRGNPEILGVWGDPRTNSLVILGPPEADQAIRETIARWEGAELGIEILNDQSLESQQRRLEGLRRSMLEQVAGHKLEIIEAEAAGEAADSERLQRLAQSLKQDMAEVEKIERKLQVIAESIERLKSGAASAPASDSGN